MSNTNKVRSIPYTTNTENVKLGLERRGGTLNEEVQKWMDENNRNKVAEAKAPAQIQREANDTICTTMAGEGNTESEQELGTVVNRHLSAIASAIEDHLTSGRDNAEVEEMCTVGGEQFDCTYATRDFLSTIVWMINQRIERTVKAQKGNAWGMKRQKRDIQRGNGTDEELLQSLRKHSYLKDQHAMYETLGETTKELYYDVTGYPYSPYEKKSGPVHTASIEELDSILKDLDMEDKK
jgi:hypothetical protein